MTLATTYSLTNTAGIDLTAVWSSASQSGTYNENVQPSPPFAPGQIVNLLQGGTAVYVKFSTGGCTGTGYAVLMPSTNPYTAAVMTSTSVGKVGDKVGIFLGSSAASSGDYGWLQVYGISPGIQTAASVGANVALLSSSTAGQLATGTGTGTTAIGNIFLTAAAAGSAGLTAGELNWPAITAVN